MPIARQSSFKVDVTRSTVPVGASGGNGIKADKDGGFPKIGDVEVEEAVKGRSVRSKNGKKKGYVSAIAASISNARYGRGECG